MTKRKLPYRNFSPERWDGLCSEASEVYSYGFTIHEILTRHQRAHPFHHQFLTNESAKNVRQYMTDPCNNPGSNHLLPPILPETNGLEPIVHLTEIYKSIFAHESADRPKFNELACQFRKLYNVIGKARAENPDRCDVDFEIPCLSRGDEYFAMEDTPINIPEVS